MMNKLKITVLILCCVILLSSSSSLVQASPFYIDDGKVFGHKGPDGTVSFFVQDTTANWKVQIHKVFLPDGKVYYFLYADLYNSNFENKPLPNMMLTLNKQDFPLQLLEGTKPIVEKRKFNGWYALPEEAVQMLTKADTMTVTLQFEETPPVTWKPFPSKLAGFKQLPLVEKAAYIREGEVLAPTREPEKAVFYPQIFIPNAKPEEVIDALIYETNFSTYKGKEEFDYSNGYFIYHTSDPQVIQLNCRNSFDRSTDFITVACRPYNNGVWVTMSLMMECYTPGSYTPGGAYFSGDTYYSFYENASSSSLFVDSREYWRTNAQIWAMRLHSVYQQLYGKIDYGFTCERKDVKKGPFKVTAVNLENFPELEGIKAGDLLTAIDGVSTTRMGIEDLDYWLDNGIGGPRAFTLQTKTGEEKKITISPQVRPTAPETRKDYKKALTEKMPKWFVKKDIYTLQPKSIFLESNIYNPLGTGLK